MTRIAAIALTITVTIFGGVEDHGFQGLNRGVVETVTVLR